MGNFLTGSGEAYRKAADLKPVSYTHLMRDTLSGAMDSIRRSVHDLHDESVDLHMQLEAMRRDCTFCPVKLDYDSGEMDRGLKLAFLAIVREALSNVMRHSDATMASVTVREHPALYLSLIHIWWEAEMPTAGEMTHGLENLEAHGNQVDYVLTHEPSARSSGYLARGARIHGVNVYLTQVEERVRFKRWFFGCLHMDKTCLLYTSPLQPLSEWVEGGTPLPMKKQRSPTASFAVESAAFMHDFPLSGLFGFEHVLAHAAQGADEIVRQILEGGAGGDAGVRRALFRVVDTMCIRDSNQGIPFFHLPHIGRGQAGQILSLIHI